jgi:phage terminase large subunit-like protein
MISTKQLSSLPKKLQLKILLEEKQRRLKRTKLYRYPPYEKQKEFHNSGALVHERLFMAGNQLGKTLSGAYEAAMHLTGEYPDWWKGIRFDKPVKMWVGGETSELIRDTSQRLMLGEIRAEWGTGTLPFDKIAVIRTKNGVNDAVDYILVKHKSGGLSKVNFKSYDQGRGKWQGETIDIIWLDEEPPYDIYTEALTRTNRGQRGQRLYMTFTPLKGMSATVNRFLSDDPKVRGKSVRVTQMGIADVDHYSDEEKEQIIGSYPEHEREARSNGNPILGSGRVFAIADSDITCAPFTIPGHFVWIAGMDFGGASGTSHPAALAKIAHDKDSDIVYITAVWRRNEVTHADIASAARGFGAIPFAWPHDGLQTDRKSGETYAEEFRLEGINMLPEHATFPPLPNGKSGGNGLEAGVLLMDKMFRKGKLKVFSTCGEFFEEFRLYHRKDGQIVKVRDDILCAVRYGLMMLRFAEILKDSQAKLEWDDKWVV